METFFKFATPIVYWVLIIVWASISIFYFKKIRLLKGYGKLLRLLLIILMIDAARSFFESLYFGVWYTSYSGLLPISVYNFLANPKIVFIPKILNLIIAVIILSLIIKKWVEYEFIEINEASEKQSFEINKLSTAVNQSVNSIVITDLKGNIEYTNPRFTKITGYTAKEVLGKSPRILNSGEQSKEYYTHMWKTISAGKKWSGEFKNKKKNGEFYWEEVNISPIRNDKNEIINYLAVKNDISRLKENEKKLLKQNEELKIAKIKVEESNDLYNKAIQATSDGLFDWNLITNDIYYSPRWKGILGYEDHELPNDFSVWEKLTEKGDVKKSWESLNKHIEGKLDKFEQEFRMLHKKGHWVDILSRGTVFFNEEGKASRFVGTHADISEITKTNYLLKKSEERFRKMNEHLPNGVVIYLPVDNGNDFKFIEVNKKAEELTNSSRNDLIGHTLLEKFPNMKNTPLINALKQILNDGLDIHLPPFYYKDANRQGWRENYIYKLNTGEIIAIFKDVTKIKEVEETLKAQNIELLKAKEKAEQNQKLYKDLVQSSHNLIWKCDLEGKFTFLNSAWENSHGYKIEEMLGRAFSDFQRPEVFNRDVIEFTKHLEGGSVVGYETTHIIKDGTEIPLIFNALPMFNTLGDIIGTQGTAFDISKLKKTELELIKAKEKAEESDRLKSAFLANMSHEIRTPMNGIVGFTDLLQNPDLSEQNQLKYAKIIKESSDRLLTTVNDIVEISKIESGEVKVSKTEIEMVNHLENLGIFFKPETEKKGLEFIIDNEIDNDTLIFHTDKNKLDSILINLIKNSIKYTIEGVIKIGLKLDEESIIFYCQDSGIGIPLNRQEAIFNRFEQSDIEDKQVHQGSGLGLAIVKSYVEILGGKIWVKSEEGKGSIFYVSLPYKPVVVNNDDLLIQVKSLKVEKKNINILIAEDDEISSLHLSVITKEIFKTVNCVQNGLEAVDTIKNDSSIDLILMDVKMPLMDGFEATKKIREFNKDVIIIAQTAFAFDEDKHKASKLGFNDFISKPIEKEKLIEVVCKYF